MRKYFPALFALLLFVPSALLAQSVPAKNPSVQAAATAGAEAAATKLPVKRVVLFKNGVGYFEHLGRVRGNQDVSIDFTSGQLNDVLKSLTALDLGSGRITGVSYNSDAPLSRRLAALRLPLGEQATVAQFLGALRGARIEVRSGVAVYTGRLLSIERKTRVSGGTTLEVDVVSLVTDAGELRTIELGPTTSVRILERELSQEVNRYMGLVASTRDRDLRRMTLSTAGTGERPLFVSYISEVPVWKTTYRLVLPSKAGAKPLLQGWAIVDNTVGEDWENVELSLVAVLLAPPGRASAGVRSTHPANAPSYAHRRIRWPLRTRARSVRRCHSWHPRQSVFRQRLARRGNLLRRRGQIRNQ